MFFQSGQCVETYAKSKHRIEKSFRVANGWSPIERLQK